MPFFEHTRELVATIEGVDYINDTTGTHPNHTWMTFSQMNGDPIIWLAGGVNRKYIRTFSWLKEIVNEKDVQCLIAIGADNSYFIKAFEKIMPIHEEKNMYQAVRIANREAIPGTKVLLSPACSSLDLYSDYRERGEVFKDAVRSL